MSFKIKTAVLATIGLLSVGVCGVPYTNAISDDSEHQVSVRLSQEDLEYCLNSASYFGPRLQDSLQMEVRGSSSLENTRRSTVGSLALLYREQPETVGFVADIDDPVLPVRAGGESLVNTSEALALNVYRPDGFRPRVEPMDESRFASVAQLCSEFVRVDRLSKETGVYMFYRISPAQQKVLVEVDKTAPVSVLRELRSRDLSVVEETQTMQLLQGRSDDTAPYAGGGAPSYAGNSCSLGYKIQNIDSGRSYMTIAGHCAPVGSQWFYGSRYVGRTSHNFVQSAFNNLDMALLEGSSYAPRIFRGDGSQVASVIGSLPGGGTVGANIGVSAGLSGEVVANYRGQAENAGCVNLGTTYCNIKTAVINGGSSVQSGDSGSPVFAYTANPNQVYALGTLTGYNYQNRQRIYYTDIEALLYYTHSRVALS